MAKKAAGAEKVTPAGKAAVAVKVGKLRFPLDRSYFTRKGAHLWLLPEKDGTVKIGMDSFLTENAGYLNYIMLDRRSSVKRGASLGSFESAKFVSKLFSPVSGRVVGVNEQVIRDPRRINKDPYGSWILALRPKDKAKDMRSPELLTGEKEIRMWIQEELARAEDVG
jgi:glycine cleavage system H protein